MALILDATPGGVLSNSYTTRSEADAYHEAHFYAASWHTLNPGQKDIALVHATRLLDEQVSWYGSKTYRSQSLRWPRTGVEERDGSGDYYDPYYGSYTLDSTTIPLWLKHATAEMARALVAEDRTADPAQLEFTEMSAGSLSLSYATPQRKEVLPESVRVMVAPYGIVTTSTGIGIAKLVRA